MRNPTAVLVLLLTTLGGSPSAAQPLGLPLTPEQVACEEGHFRRLLHRMTSGYAGSALFLWHASSPGNGYRGLAVTNEMYFTTVFGDRERKEKQLAFDLILRGEEDFLNPRRSPLPQATLVRRDVASNLDAPTEDTFSMLAQMDLAPEVANPSFPTLPIRITTLRLPGAGHDDGAGRGIAVDDLLATCHVEVTDFDLKVFSIIARTVRPTACLEEPVPPLLLCAGGRFKSAIYRAEEPLTYRVDFYLYTSFCDDDGQCGYGETRTPVLIRLQVDGVAQLVGGEIATLPWCTAGGQRGCIENPSPLFGVYVLPPIRPGVEVQGEATFRRAAHLNIDGDGSPFNVLRDDVDWTDLLRDTAWNGAAPPP